MVDVVPCIPFLGDVQTSAVALAVFHATSA